MLNLNKIAAVCVLLTAIVSATELMSEKEPSDQIRMLKRGDGKSGIYSWSSNKCSSSTRTAT